MWVWSSHGLQKDGGFVKAERDKTNKSGGQHITLKGDCFDCFSVIDSVLSSLSFNRVMIC